LSISVGDTDNCNDVDMPIYKIKKIVLNNINGNLTNIFFSDTESFF